MPIILDENYNPEDKNYMFLFGLKQEGFLKTEKANIRDWFNNELLKQLFECENPYNCAHGRPTIIRMSVKEIEEMFERIQK